MKQGYTIRIESENPDFEVDRELREGITVDGFLLLTIRDGDPEFVCINHMTIMELAKFFSIDDKGCIKLRQAAVIGEGMRKAAELGSQCYRNVMSLEPSGSLDEETKRAVEEAKRALLGL